AGDEIDELHLGNRPQPKIAHAAGRTDDRTLGDGRVDDPLPAEFFQQTLAGFERTAIHADVFTNEHDTWVGGHLFEHGLTHCFEKGNGSHYQRAPFFTAFFDADFFGSDCLGDFNAGLIGDSGATAGSSVFLGTSPKWIGAEPPPEVPPRPNPSTSHTGST